MFKGIGKIFIAGVALVAIQSAFSMEIYTVQSNDYLYKIAKSHTINGVSISDLTDAIKGINKSEIPGIVDNRIKVGDKLAIPTSKSEVEDGLTLTRNQMIQGSYDQSGDNTSTTRLGDNSMLSGNQPASQDQVPTLLPVEEGNHQTYKSNLDSQISSDTIEETASYDDQDSGSFFMSLVKLVIYIAILAGLFLVAKKFWDNRSDKKEQELEIIGKKKRDHLMSRISPVVSGNEFYKAETANTGPQEEFDFFNENVETQDSSPIYDQNQDDENLTGEISDLFEDEHEKALYKERDKNIAVKTEKGVVFETNTDDSVVIKSQDDENQVEEVDSQEKAEQELLYINELIEQFLESEKYIEASITIQDSLEKDPNNIDLRYKLLEVYAQAGDEIAFEGEVHFIKSKNIVSMFDPLHQKIAKLRDKYFE